MIESQSLFVGSGVHVRYVKKLNWLQDLQTFQVVS